MIAPTRGAYATYMVMERYLQVYGCIPSQDEIARELAVSRTQIQRNLRRLRLCGYIEHERGKPRHIKLLKGAS